MNYDEIFSAKIIESLRELSDEAFQRRVWLASSGSEVSSFAEAVCGLFDDTGLRSLLEHPEKRPVFSKEVYEALNELGQLIGRATRTFHSLPPTSVIEHPQMQLIRTAASSILGQILGAEGN